MTFGYLVYHFFTYSIFLSIRKITSNVENGQHQHDIRDRHKIWPKVHPRLKLEYEIAKPKKVRHTKNGMAFKLERKILRNWHKILFVSDYFVCNENGCSAAVVLRKIEYYLIFLFFILLNMVILSGILIYYYARSKWYHSLVQYALWSVIKRIIVSLILNVSQSKIPLLWLEYFSIDYY